MKPLNLSLALSVPLALALTAAPAMAAPDYHRGNDSYAQGKHYSGFGQATNLRKDIRQLDNRIDRAMASHRISYREAASLRRDVNSLERQFAQFSRGGITRYEARTLEARIASVERKLVREIRDDNGKSRNWQRR
ncbi:MAG: hypothetical protein KDE55_04400 [Novosphingobium sp.]|nr:hypothetical protein [Novosphingobium sp.]